MQPTSNRLLLVTVSPRGDHSISRDLTKRFLHAWREAHPNAQLVERDLAKTDLAFVTAPWLEAYFTPPNQQSPAMRSQLALSDALVAELVAADHLVIATPVYNYNVPATLKAWIDHIVRKGVTLGMDGTGLLKNKKATVLLASGGVYTEGSPIRDRDLATHYLRLILNVVGITDVTFVAAGGAKAVDLKQIGRDDFLNQFQSAIASAAG